RSFHVTGVQTCALPIFRGACGGHRPSSGDLPLQVDEPCVFPAVSLPFVIVRLDVAGPTTIPAAGIETNNCPEDFFQLSVGDVNRSEERRGGKDARTRWA